MAELYIPPQAKAAQIRATTLRQRYTAAVAAINGNRQLSTEEKRQRLAMLHQRHRQAMTAERTRWHDAFEAELAGALRKLVRNHGADVSSITMDRYSRRLTELMGQKTDALVDAYNVAEMIGDDVSMQAVAVVALRRRVPGVPGDAATRLVHRFAYAQEPDGDGRLRFAHPQPSLGWDRLRELEAWERQDHLAAEAVFSVSSTPPRPEAPKRDPHTEAVEDVAALYSPNGAPAAPAQGGGGGGGGGEPAAP